MRSAGRRAFRLLAALALCAAARASALPGPCGDVNADEQVLLNDATLVRRALAGLGPGLARPDLCNVAGANDARDPDGDGVTADCGLDDVVVLKRALLGLPPGLGDACGVPPDEVAPRVSLAVPAAVQGGGSLPITADASDDVGVARVELFVDGALLRAFVAPPYRADYAAPAAPGLRLRVRADAFDAAGNAASAEAEVPVVEEADTTPPVIDSVQLAPAAPAGRSAPVRAEVRDDRGVALVRFLQGEQTLGEDATPPYAATLLVPGDAAPGARFDVAVEARDAAGNVARASASLVVAAAPDEAAPDPVTLQVPAQARPGDLVRVAVAAADDVGIERVEIALDGAPLALVRTTPYQAEYRVPADALPGTRLRWSAVAFDFAGNASAAEPLESTVVARGDGLAFGEVYDESSGRPLAGAQVELTGPGGASLSRVSDARGRWSAPLPEGEARARVTLPGYTSAERSFEVEPGAVVAPLDARLVPLAPPVEVDPVTPARVGAGAGGPRLELPAGALGGPAAVRLTALGEQALPSPLPPGWSPLAAAQVAIDGAALRAPLALVFPEAALAPGAVAARFDSASDAWIRVEARALAAAGGVEVAVDRAGAFAVAAPDAVPFAPPAPAAGAALAGVAPVALGSGAELELLPSPRVLVASSDARADVRARLARGAPPPSGTPVTVDFRESYASLAGALRAPAATAQDFLLYARPAGSEAGLLAAPSIALDPAALREGVIELEARSRPASDGRAALGVAGGVVSTPDGVSIELPANALAAGAAVAVRRLPARATPLAPDPRLLPLGGFALDVTGSALLVPASASLAPEVAPPPGATLLVARAADAEGATRLEWVGGATLSGSTLEVTASAAGIPLPGVSTPGEYFALAVTPPLAFAAGAVAPGALVACDALPFVAFGQPGGRYALPVPVGPARVAATDPATGASAAADSAAAAPGALVALDLALAALRPAVVRLDPADGAQRVAPSAVVSVAFSRAIDPSTLGPASLELLDAGVPVAGAAFLLPDGVEAVFRPAALLAGGRSYTVRVGAGVSDVFGNPLAGNQPDGSFVAAFVTLDQAPPPRPTAGAISLSIPSDGVTEIFGGPGTLPLGGRVLVENATRGSATAALAAPDGGFYAQLDAAADDEIRLTLVSEGGARTPLEPIAFGDGRGTTLLGPRGGEARSPGGLRASVLPAALRSSVAVTLTDLAAGSLGLPPGVEPVAGFRLALPDDAFSDVTVLEMLEESGRFASSPAFGDPFRVASSLQTGTDVGAGSRFAFAARARDALGQEVAARVLADGAAQPCAEVADAAQDARAPRLRLRAPTCLGPAQAFRLEASAIQPRLDLSASAPAGSAAGERFLVLRRDGAAWVVAEVALAVARGAELRIETESLTPHGVRSSGDYAIARAAAPLAFVEGTSGGPIAALGASDVAWLAPVEGGAFLLPVLAETPFELRALGSDGALLATETRGALASGATAAIADLGVAAPPPLELDVTPAEGGEVAPTGPVVFRFDDALDPATVTGANLFVTDASGRLVRGALALEGDARSVRFAPERPWQLGRSYAWRVTRGVIAQSGARLQAERSGSFAPFAPRVLGVVTGSDVSDAVARGSAAYLLDGGRLRAVDVSDPARPVEGAAVDPGPSASRLALSPLGLLATSGNANEYGALGLFDVSAPLAPEALASAGLSTPSGAPARAGVPDTPGAPGPLADVDDAIVVATRERGLQRVPLPALSPVGPTPPLVELLGDAGGAVALASAAGRLLRAGPDGLFAHDAATLAPLARADLAAAPLDLAAGTVGGRALAVVAEGLTGGIEVFEWTPAGAFARVARILPGCAVTRVALDAPLGRAWLACSGTTLASVDLMRADGAVPVDLDADGQDDRVGGRIPLPLALRGLSLDAARSLALVSAGAQGLALVQLGPAEVAFVSARRDPLRAASGDDESILSTGRAFYGDDALDVAIEARIPPGHPGLRARLDGAASLAFAGGAREVALAPGRNDLSVSGIAASGAATADFAVRVIEAPAGAEVAALAGRIDPVSLDSLVSVRSPSERLATATDAQLSLIGRDASGRSYDVTALASFAIDDPGLGSVAPGGAFTAAGGGSAVVRWSVGTRRGAIEISVQRPPALARIEVEPAGVVLRASGGTATLRAIGVWTDGSRRDLGAADGLSFAVSAPGVVDIATNGALSALADGETTVEARLGALAAAAVARVSIRQPAALEAISVALDEARVPSDVGVVSASSWVSGTGSLDGLPVVFRLELPGTVPTEQLAATNADGFAEAVFRGVTGVGAGALRARVAPPGGTVLEAEAALEVFARNSDVEPNADATSAPLLETDAILSGRVGDGPDQVDVFRVSLTRAGRLRAVVALAAGPAPPVAVELVDANGAVLASSSGSEVEHAVQAAVEGTRDAWLRITALGAAASYALSVELSADRPRVDALEPASGRAGDRIVIRGGGFDRRREHDVVSFEGALAEVVSAEPDRLEVLVPAWATDGPVTVAVGSARSEGVEFGAGRAGRPIDFAILEPSAPPERFAPVPFSDLIALDHRLRVGFRPSVSAAAASAIASMLGASVVGVWPPTSEYVLEFPPGTGFRALDRALESLRALPEVVWAGVVAAARPDGIAIDGRDDFSSPFLLSDDRIRSAYEQINAFAAWEFLIGTGRFDDPERFAPVTVAVIDERHRQNPNNELQLAGVLSTADLSSELTLPSPPPQSHGSQVIGIIAGRNTGAASSGRRSTGILGGPIRAGVLPTYRVVSYDAEKLVFEPNPDTGTAEAVIRIDDREVKAAFQGCNFYISPDPALACLPELVVPWHIANLSFGNQFPNPTGPISAAEIADWQATHPGDDATAAKAGIQSKRKQNIEDEVARYAGYMKARPNLLVVASAGNSNAPAKLHVPGGALSLDPSVGARVISVAAVGQGFYVGAYTNAGNPPNTAKRLGLAAPTAVDHGADTRAIFSNYGIGVDLTAPGTAVATIDGSFSGTGPEVTLFSGTSAAAPMVAGAAALVRSLLPAYDAAAIKKLLVAHATPIDVVPKPKYKDASGAEQELGWGDWPQPRRLDLLAAVQAALARRLPAAGPPPVAIDATEPPWPGRQRALFALDTRDQNLIRVRFGAGFDVDAQDLEVESIPLPTPLCPSAVALTVSKAGDEIYIACRKPGLGGDRILVWNTRANQPASLEGASTISLSLDLAPGPTLEMGLSPDGEVLVVPLVQRYLEFVNLRAAGTMDLRQYDASLVTADQELRAVAFTSDGQLLAIAAEEGEQGSNELGVLLRTRPGLGYWGIEDPIFTARKSLADDEPRRLAVHRSAQSERAVVTYTGDRAERAASVYDPETLELLRSIDAELPGRGPGGTVVPGQPVYQDEDADILRTATHRAAALAVEPNAGDFGVFLFFDTGNLAVSTLTSLDALGPLRAATAPSGTFEDQEPPSGEPDYALYFPDRYGTAVAMDQGAQVVGAAFSGRSPALEFHDAPLLRAGPVILADPAREPIDGTLLRRLDGEAVGFLAPREISFGPQLEIASPRGGQLTRGAIAVHVVMRDAFATLQCELRDAVTDVSYPPVADGPLLTSALPLNMLDAGVAWRILATTPTSVRPICLYAGLPASEYELEVRGVKSAGSLAIARRRFVHVPAVMGAP